MGNRVSLTMIVKNGATTLGRCLTSVHGIVDEIIIVDTGSTDCSREVATKFGAQVYNFRWCDDFAAARNEGLSHTTGDWIFWIDADEYLDQDNHKKLHHLFTNLKDDNVAFVMTPYSPSSDGASTIRLPQVRLYRKHPMVRWEYRVHEQPVNSLLRAGFDFRWTDVLIPHTGYQDSATYTRKMERYLRLLLLDQNDHPDDPLTLYNLGLTYIHLERFNEALFPLHQILHQHRSSDANLAKVYSALICIHCRLGQFVEAWAVCQAGHLHYPEDAKLLFLKGQLCHRRGDRIAARACWLQLLEARSATGAPPFPEICEGAFTSIDRELQVPFVRHRLAEMDRQEGRFHEAENQWRTLLEETPSFHLARLGLAELYLRQERWPKLETLLAELEAHAPLDSAVLRARMHQVRLNFFAARQLLEEALRQAPNDLPAHVILSQVLLQSGDECAAEPQLRRIVEMDAGQAESWRNLTVLYRRTQRLHDAIAAAKAGCLHCPHDADLLLLQGALLREGGDALNAETCLLRVLEMATGNGPAQRLRTTARQLLIALYRGLGRYQEADAHSRALAAQSPESGKQKETA